MGIGGQAAGVGPGSDHYHGCVTSAGPCPFARDKNLPTGPNVGLRCCI